MGNWTPEEKQLLRCNFGKVGREEMLRLLPGRTYRGIKQAAVSEGLQRLPEKRDLRELVAAGLSLRRIGRLYDLDGKTIHRYCQQYGVELRSQGEATSLANRNELPEGLFAGPLDPQMSWVLGIIATDGNISDAGRLRVVSVDQDIPAQCLEVCGVGSVYKQTSDRDNIQTQYTWSYTCRTLSSRLARLGVVPRKTWTLGLPRQEQVHLPSYVRGLWDGDGHWRVDKHGVFRCGFGSASRSFVEGLWQLLKPVVRSGAKVYKHPSKEYWVIRLDKQRARRLAEWIYQEPCGAYCKRKRDIVCLARSMSMG